MLIAASMASQSALDSRTGAGMEDVAEMAKQMTRLGARWDGTVTIYTVTSTVSRNGDQGADPNQVVMITDQLSATSLPANETFSTFQSAGYGEVLRGVSFTPSNGKRNPGWISQLG